MASITQPQPYAPAPTARPAVRARDSGLLSWLTTIDHKRIGILYGASAFTFLLLGGLEAMIIRLQLARPENDLVSLERYNQLFTMHGTTMIFLAIMPLSVAFFNFVVPLQIGARDVAFPRLNAFSYWTFLFGAIILNISWLANAAPNQGWYGYAPLTEKIALTGSATSPFSVARNVDFWALGLQVLGVASMAGSFNFIVTILNMRAPGVSMMRMPIFTWAALVTNVLIVLAFPAITVALLLLSFDRFLGTHFYIPSYIDQSGQMVLTGGDPLLWQHLFWIFGHPEVYIMVLPAFGIVSEIIPVFSRKPLFGYAVMAYALAAIAFLGFGVWVHHMFTTGLGPTPNAVFSATSMLIAIPTGVKIFNWVGTMFGGHLNFTTPMLFAVGLVSQFTIGGISGVMHAAVPVDWHQNDSYFVVAHIHYVLFGGSLFGLLAGIYFWFPKITGKLLDERLGKWHFWLTFAAFNLTFFPMHFLGLEGMPRRYSSYGEGSGWWFWNIVVSCGGILLGATFVLFLYSIAKSLQHGKAAGADPWDGSTLEWSIPSPPPHYNFATYPVTASRDPLWEAKYGSHGHAPLPQELAVVEKVHAGVEDVEAPRHPIDHSVHVHMPNPSYYPLLAALGLFLIAIGLIFSQPRFNYQHLSVPIVSILGGIVLVLGIYGWALEPASDPEPAAPVGAGGQELGAGTP